MSSRGSHGRSSTGSADEGSASGVTRPWPSAPGDRRRAVRMARAATSRCSGRSLAGFPDRVARRQGAGLVAAGPQLGRGRPARAGERGAWRGPAGRARGVGRRGRGRLGADRQGREPRGTRVAGRHADRDRPPASTRTPGPCAPSRRTGTTGCSWASGRCPRTPRWPLPCWRKPSSGAASGRPQQGCSGACASRGSKPTCTPRWWRPARAARACLPSASPRPGSIPARASRLDRLAPQRLALPSGRTCALDYREDGSVVAAAKLQELFGLAETPARRAAAGARSSSSCSRRTAGRCRRRGTCAASGSAPTPRCARSCAAGTRGTRGPTIRGPPSRRTARHAAEAP